MKKIIYFLVLLLAGLSACRKKDVSTDGPSKKGSTLDLIRDSIYLYTKETYYWNAAIPDYKTFNPRGISGSNDDAAVNNEVNRLSQLAINPLTQLPYEYVANSGGEAKYSFIDNGQTSASLGGTNGDFGFTLIYTADPNDLRVRYVYPGSSAANTGMHRGDRVVAVNNRTSLSSDVNADFNFIVNALGGNSIALTLRRADGSTYNATVTKGSYTVNPVITYKVIDLPNNKKVGYFVFNSFTSPENAQPKLNEVFNAFNSAGITDLVVDLRYNGGGYTSTAEYLSNLIVPAAKSGTTMYDTYFNSILASGKAEILKNQVRRDNNGLYNYAQINFSTAANNVKFTKQGSLAINRVFFIVTGNTASASELTINNLRPHMNVQLVGRTTYGKPVGFFDIKINKYELYVPQFETKNSEGKGGYYTGMAPGSADYPGVNAGDDVTKDFGDVTEGLLARTLNYIKSGSYTVTSTQSSSALATNAVAAPEGTNQKLDEHNFKGMIYDKPMVRK